jgi:hypothetical protein
LHDEASGLPKIPQKKPQRIPPPPEIDSTPIFVKASVPGEPTSMARPMAKRGLNAGAGEIPEPTSSLQVGNHEETMWFDNERVATHPEHPRGMSMEEIRARHADEYPGLYMEQQEAPPNAEAAPRKVEQPQAESTATEGEEDTVNPGEYAIYYRGALVAKRYNPDEVRGVVASMVSEHVELDEIYIYKRIPVRFGILLE